MVRKIFPNSEAVAQAAALIRAGKLVAFPTETVYGLGANALDPAAVERIFQAKGRPHTSPLIVHVPSIGMARSLVRNWPDEAERLAGRYWPGPLTLVLPKQPAVPSVVTAGLDTVGLRIPAHPVALALLNAAGVPIAAPSANRFTELSPTRAEHVEKALGEAADMILDGGPTTVGIESTVLSLANQHPLLLRAGMVSQVEIEALIGPVTMAGRVEDAAAHASPGMHRSHYRPRTPLVVVENGALPASGQGAYLWIRQRAAAAALVEMPDDAARYAAILYETLHQLDAQNWDWIAVEKPPQGAAWAGIADRLGRAGNRKPA
jgi:L-threonylcarbamoyladenylate synthase